MGCHTSFFLQWLEAGTALWQQRSRSVQLCKRKHSTRGNTSPHALDLIRSQIIKQLSTSRDREIRPRRLSCDMSAAPPSSEPAVQGIDDNRLTIIASQAWLLFNLLIHGNCQHTIILILQVGENFMDLDVIVRADTFSS